MKQLISIIKRWFKQYPCDCGGTITETVRGASCDKCGYSEYYP